MIPQTVSDRYYDMDKEWGNRSIANFYGKDAVYIYLEE